MSSFTSFRNAGFRRKEQEAEEDPMSGLANLADCMLVLACGLMVALVVAWNVDLTQVTEVSKTDATQEISDLDTMTDESQSGGSAYIDMGRVYQDPETGKLYMIEETSSEGSSNANEGDANSADASSSDASSANSSGE